MGLLKRIKNAFDPDRVLQEVMNGFIEAVAVERALDVRSEAWRPGKPLKLLFAGYVGTRNTGADVRVEEMIRQIRHVLGDDEIELTIMTVDPKLTAGYFRTVRQVEASVWRSCTPAISRCFCATCSCWRVESMVKLRRIGCVMPSDSPERSWGEKLDRMLLVVDRAPVHPME